jgi:hypothetical protein
MQDGFRAIWGEVRDHSRLGLGYNARQDDPAGSYHYLDREESGWLVEGLW